MVKQVHVYHLLQSTSAMEAMRLNAFNALARMTSKCHKGYDLLSLTKMIILWNEIGHNIGFTFETGVTRSNFYIACKIDSRLCG